MKTMHVDELKRAVIKNEDMLILNVLGNASHRVEHVPGSKNVPLDSQDFDAKVEQLAGSKGRKVVVYCAGPECDLSTKAARRLEKNGFSHVYDFEGGMEAWKQANEPVAAET